jgi:hypothetical protein
MSDPVEYWRQRAILAEGFARRLRREVSDEIRSLHAHLAGVWTWTWSWTLTWSLSST